MVPRFPLAAQTGVTPPLSRGTEAVRTSNTVTAVALARRYLGRGNIVLNRHWQSRISQRPSRSRCTTNCWRYCRHRDQMHLREPNEITSIAGTFHKNRVVEATHAAHCGQGAYKIQGTSPTGTMIVHIRGALQVSSLDEGRASDH